MSARHGRFARLEKKLATRKGIRNPKAMAASIGRQKPAEQAKRSAAERQRHG